eukprot:490349_1
MKFTILFCICIGIICQTNASVGYRSDETGTLSSIPKDTADDKYGGKGDWSNTIYCNDGYFAIGFWLKVGSSTSDAVGADSFEMYCSDSEDISADNGAADGIWSSYVGCSSGSYIVGYRTKVQEDGHSDDTALNSVQILCSDDTSLEPSNGGEFGSWGDWEKCDKTHKRKSVCGFKQKVQEKGGTFVDDTALNAIELNCCQNPKTFSNPIGYWNRIAGLGGGGILSATTSYGVTNHEESEITKAFGTSVTNEVSLGLKFEGIGISGSTSDTMSSEIAQQTVQAVSTKSETVVNYVCEEGDEAMYQWITKMTENAMTETFEFEIKSNDKWCIS